MYYTKGGIAWTVIISLWAVFASLAAAAAASVPVYVVFIAGGQQCFRFRNAFRGDRLRRAWDIHVLRLQRSVNGHCCAYTQDHGVDKKPFYKKGGSVK